MIPLWKRREHLESAQRAELPLSSRGKRKGARGRATGRPQTRGVPHAPSSSQRVLQATRQSHAGSSSTEIILDYNDDAHLSGEQPSFYDRSEYLSNEMDRPATPSFMDVDTHDPADYSADSAHSQPFPPLRFKSTGPGPSPSPSPPPITLSTDSHPPGGFKFPSEPPDYPTLLLLDDEAAEGVPDQHNDDPWIYGLDAFDPPDSEPNSDPDSARTLP
jgi:hypothetical protein